MDLSGEDGASGMARLSSETRLRDPELLIAVPDEVVIDVIMGT